jgi:hypothetical protein
MGEVRVYAGRPDQPALNPEDVERHLNGKVVESAEFNYEAGQISSVVLRFEGGTWINVRGDDALLICRSGWVYGRHIPPQPRFRLGYDGRR